MLYRLLRPFLFMIDPEQAHKLSLRGLDLLENLGLLKWLMPKPVRAPVTVMGIEFPNAVGLAAGMDKNGDHIMALSRFGFGHIEIGTVTPRPQPGNPKPRMFRLPAAEGIINRMGFNNDGVDKLVQNVRNSGYRGVLGINIGKNFDTPIEQAVNDYLICLDKVYPLASYVAVNISSPNTKNLRQLQESEELEKLLSALKSRQTELAREHDRYVPLALKIAPDLDPVQIRDIAERVIRHHFDAVIATNTTISRAGVEHLPHGGEMGGLSGAPVCARATSVIRELAGILHGSGIPVIGVGGILDGEGAVEKTLAGAQLVQVYSGLVYRGPDLVRDCAAALQQQRANHI
ncbi:dihydroorotate oxidase A [Formivibrio citricus]|uniref:Dihydroorotate dehydrogenase (quinone) n=1 Tax=Formivibrio citricus TaxID=83765 RepID=A0A1I5AGM2_9NEIS|nr:quinone-dependent dihydroorotate dehydrogenase [Formivibrio citricus]SFN61585.1 dihydroorotate oxidase A [Formivibrio citricus]